MYLGIRIVLIFFVCLLSSSRLNSLTLESDKFYEKWDNNINIITPIEMPYLSNIHINMLMSIYEDKLIEKQSEELDIGISYLNTKEDWRNKYLKLLSYLSSKRPNSSYSKHTITEKYTDYSNENYKKPGAYNLVIVLHDNLPPKQDKKSYCTIYIDKMQKAETNIAFLSQKKMAKLKVSPIRKHRLGIVKFTLNEKKNEWKRQINLLQPTPKYFIVPKDRIRVIEILYDAYKESPETAHLKYKYTTYFLKQGSGEY